MSDTDSYVRHFIDCNRRDMSRFMPFYIGKKAYGYVTKDLVSWLLSQPDLFIEQADGIGLQPEFTDFTTRSGALQRAALRLAEYHNKPLRQEMYAVTQKWGDDPIAQIDRVAVPWFGMRAWGIHVNGFVRCADGIYLWIGERAADRPADPGKLDNMIGGGQPIGLTVAENLCKEAAEETGIEAHLARLAQPVGTISYQMERHGGLRRDTLFIYDLELSADVIPRNTDGEVAAFHLMSLPEVADRIQKTNQFKFNCNLVIIDFLVRHNFIKTDHREYTALLGWLKP